MAKEKRRRAGPEEYERRLAEVTELVVARVVPSAVVRFAVEKWGVGQRAAQKYVAEAMRRLREQLRRRPRAASSAWRSAGYELIFRRQLTAGDLQAARATLDRLVRLLGLAAPAEASGITIEMIDAEIARLEAEIAGARGADAVSPRSAPLRPGAAPVAGGDEVPMLVRDSGTPVYLPVLECIRKRHEWGRIAAAPDRRRSVGGRHHVQRLPAAERCGGPVMRARRTTCRGRNWLHEA